jgi:large conductance mechanosensitive channel
MTKVLGEFREFIARGNVLDLAVAVVIGATFAKVVNTLVEGVLMPPLGMLTAGLDFAGLFYVLDTSRGLPTSLADAKARSIPVIAYGQLLMDIVQFLVVALAVFLVVRQVNRFRRPAAATTKQCPMCLSAIPIQATRCAYCTSVL